MNDSATLKAMEAELKEIKAKGRELTERIYRLRRDLEITGIEVTVRRGVRGRREMVELTPEAYSVIRNIILDSEAESDD